MTALGGRRRTVLAPPGKTAAAVLVPLLAVDGAPSLLFTRRSNLMPHHQGQIAFPGGRHHPDADADLAATALREAQEEIGLDPADVHLLGPLDDIETVATRFVITPFVGVAPHPYDFRPSPDEAEPPRSRSWRTTAAPAWPTSSCASCPRADRRSWSRARTIHDAPGSGAACTTRRSRRRWMRRRRTCARAAPSSRSGPRTTPGWRPSATGRAWRALSPST